MKDKIVVEINPKIADLIPRYLEEQQEKAGWIREALHQEDFEQVRRLGHDMKGTGGAYGFPTISMIGKGIEDAARASDAALIQQGVQHLEEYIERVEIRSR